MKKYMYFIYNDGELANKEGYDHSLLCIAENIESESKAKEILKSVLKRYPDEPKKDFFIHRNDEIVEERLDDGETLEEIFNGEVIYY
jgi:hypothetical protein